MATNGRHAKQIFECVPSAKARIGIKKEKEMRVNKLNLTGKKFDRLIVLRQVKIFHSGTFRLFCFCLCRCGNKKFILQHSLVAGDTRSCGCLHIEEAQSRRVNIKGKKIFRLKVIEYSHSDKTGRVFWKCKCLCGRIVNIASSNLRSGSTKSCGCLFLEKQLRAQKRKETKSKHRKKRRRINLKNKKFGRLTVIKIFSWKFGTTCNTPVNYLCRNDHRF